MAIQIQLRRDSASDWTTENPILADGEMGIESDTRRIKFGNGTEDWNTLPYFEGAGTDLGFHVTDVTSNITITSANVDTYLNGTNQAILLLNNDTGTINISVDDDAFSNNNMLTIKHFNLSGTPVTDPWRITSTGTNLFEHPLRDSLEIDVIGNMDDSFTWLYESADSGWFIISSFVHDVDAGVEVKDEGTTVGTNALSLDFVGDGVTVTGTGDEKTITIAGDAGTDDDAIHDNVAGEINAISEKTTPVDADVIIIEDSADSFNKKKVQISNLPTGVGEDNYVDAFSGLPTGAGYQLNIGRTGSLSGLSLAIPNASGSNSGVISLEAIRDVSAGIITEGTGINNLGIEIVKDDGADTVTFNLIDTTPSLTEHTYINNQDDNVVANFTTTGGNSEAYTATQTINIPTFTGSDYVGIAQPTSENDITSLVIDGVEQLGAFTKGTGTISLSGVSYEVWFSNNELTGSIVSDAPIIITR